MHNTHRLMMSFCPFPLPHLRYRSMFKRDCNCKMQRKNQNTELHSQSHTCDNALTNSNVRIKFSPTIPNLNCYLAEIVHLWRFAMKNVVFTANFHYYIFFPLFVLHMKWMKWKKKRNTPAEVMCLQVMSLRNSHTTSFGRRFSVSW